MSRELHFPIPDLDVDTIKNIEPARLIDASLAALQHRLNGFVEGKAHPDADLRRKVEAAHRDLKKVRNAWVLILGTARLQCIGGDG